MITLRTILMVLAGLTLLTPVTAVDDSLDSMRQTGKAFAAIARAVSPSVAFIQIEHNDRRPNTEGKAPPMTEDWPFGDDLLKRFFGDAVPGFPRWPRLQPPLDGQRIIGQGSGFVYATHSGLLADKVYLVTNNHVVENADKITVKFPDGREFDARITGRDPHSDIAVIEIKAPAMPALKLANSAQLEIGEWVVAIGNPFGLSNSLTVGVVSAKGRTAVGINDYEDFIQTDAAINPGNSGGPLLNLDGKVVGVNTAIFSRSGGYMGVGFAIPSDLVRTIASELIEHGTVTRGYLGLSIQALTAELAKAFGLSQNQGILIAEVMADSPAAKAGLRAGDIILNFRGEAVSDVGGFRNRVAQSKPGTKETLLILRDGERRTLKVSIGKLEPDKLLTDKSGQTREELGLNVQTLSPALAAQFNIEAGTGVVVTAVQPGSIAALAAITPGTLILQVNHKAVGSAEEFKRRIDEVRAQKRVLLLTRKDQRQSYVVLSW